MKTPQNVFVIQSKLAEVRDGQLLFQDRKNSVTFPAGFPVSGQFLSDWLGRNVRVLVVDGVAVQVRRRRGLIKTVKYPRDV